MKKCLHCGKEFKPKQNSHVTCSSKCRRAKYNARPAKPESMALSFSYGNDANKVANVIRKSCIRGTELYAKALAAAGYINESPSEAA